MQEKRKAFWHICCKKGIMIKERVVVLAKKGVTWCGRAAHTIAQKTRLLVAKVKELTDFKQQRKDLYASWEKEAQKGNEEACYKLMMLYFDEAEEYYPLAFKWTQHIACTRPDCAAMLQLAKMYDEGHGTAPNPAQALTWYEHCLSLHIIRGKHSPLSTDAANFVQQRIQTLRAQKSTN